MTSTGIDSLPNQASCADLQGFDRDVEGRSAGSALLGGGSRPARTSGFFFQHESYRQAVGRLGLETKN